MARKGLVERIKRIGPGTIVAAAIVGPGTVTTASSVGAEFGYILIWALVFSVLATMFLQEMTTRLGVVSRMDLGAAFRNQFQNPILKTATILLIISAIFCRECGIRSG